MADETADQSRSHTKIRFNILAIRVYTGISGKGWEADRSSNLL
jgi:hypothetical protein